MCMLKGYVRGVVMICGFLMVPHKDGGCMTTCLVHTALGGLIPSGIMNHISFVVPAKLARSLAEIATTLSGEENQQEQEKLEVSVVIPSYPFNSIGAR